MRRHGEPRGHGCAGRRRATAHRRRARRCSHCASQLALTGTPTTKARAYDVDAGPRRCPLARPDHLWPRRGRRSRTPTNQALVASCHRQRDPCRGRTREHPQRASALVRTEITPLDIRGLRGRRAGMPRASAGLDSPPFWPGGLFSGSTLLVVRPVERTTLPGPATQRGPAPSAGEVSRPGRGGVRPTAWPSRVAPPRGSTRPHGPGPRPAACRSARRRRSRRGAPRSPAAR